MGISQDVFIHVVILCPNKENKTKLSLYNEWKTLYIILKLMFRESIIDGICQIFITITKYLRQGNYKEKELTYSVHIFWGWMLRNLVLTLVRGSWLLTETHPRMTTWKTLKAERKWSHTIQKWYTKTVKICPARPISYKSDWVSIVKS